MRTLGLILAAAVLLPGVGCKWLDEMRGKDTQTRRGTGKIEPVPAERLVAYLNDRAARLQSIEYDNTRMRVSGKGIPVPATLEGNLAAAQPRSFRMVSTGRISSSIKMDMGSNPEQFWVYVSAPGDDPLYVYASHSDFESGKAKMPGGLPFEPDWVMQTLGLTTYPAGLPYTSSVSERDRAYTLSWQARTPTGADVRKEVVFDHDGGGTRPVVRRHAIFDAKGGLIAAAEVKATQTVVLGTDRDGHPVQVQYPTHVVLKWENPRFEMDLSLEKAAVNPAAGEDPARRGLFARPDIRGARAIDLAHYEFPPLK